jgi:hypothetical protein
MIFTSESGLLDIRRRGEWDAWYLGHLAAMAAVPGIASALRFRALSEGTPPSLAMYTVASPAVFDSEIYRRTRGMGPFVALIDERLHRRNLFDGLDEAPAVEPDAILLVADRIVPGAPGGGVTWLRAVAIDHSTPYRGIAVCPDLPAAQAFAKGMGGAALYAPMTARFGRAEAD